MSTGQNGSPCLPAKPLCLLWVTLPSEISSAWSESIYTKLLPPGIFCLHILQWGFREVQDKRIRENMLVIILNMAFSCQRRKPLYNHAQSSITIRFVGLFSLFLSWEEWLALSDFVRVALSTTDRTGCLVAAFLCFWCWVLGSVWMCVESAWEFFLGSSLIQLKLGAWSKVS